MFHQEWWMADMTQGEMCGRYYEFGKTKEARVKNLGD